MGTLNLRIKMLSDWRIGSGKGRQGAVDELVQRDGDGFPFIPVSTLRGVWRDAAEQLAFALDGGETLDNGKTGPWQNAVSHLFGSQPAIDDRGKQGCKPIASLLDVKPARLEEAVRALLIDKKKKDRKPLRDALTFIKPGVAIDANTGSAKHNALRFIEICRTGAVLECEAEIKCEDKALEALAVCSASMITSIGGDRRRGAGKCEVTATVDGMTLEQAIGKLRGNAPAGLSAKKDDFDPDFSVQTSGTFTKYPLTIKLLSPVIIAEEILGNTITTRDHIPGTLLLGPVLQALGLEGMDTEIVNGDLRVLPAYPRAGEEHDEEGNSISDGKRTMPTPLCWREKKDDGKFPEMLNRFERKEPCGEVWKTAASSFFLANGKFPRFVGKSLSVFTHNTVEDNSQTPTSDVGGVYTYEALSDGQTFAAELWVRGGLKDVAGKSGKTSLGRAVNAGYGQVEISCGNMIDNDGKKIRGANPILYFASDCLLPPCDSPQDGIKQLLKKAGVTADIEQDYAFIKTVRLEGWMPRAGLPRPSQIAIKAGSVVQLKNISGDLANAAQEGLGARKAEGFGVVEFNPAIVDLEKRGEEVSADKDRAEPKPPEAKIPPLTEQAKHFLEVVQKACLKQRINERAEQFADNPNNRESLLGKNTEMSQLGNLRAVMGLLEDDKAIATTRKWLKGKKENWVMLLRILFQNPEFIICADMIPSSLFGVKAANFLKSDDKITRYAILCLVAASIRAHKRCLEKRDREEIQTKDNSPLEDA